MFGKLMNRFYYGQSGKGDFTEEDLPQNRWQLFWEMLRIRFSALIRLNLIYAIIWAPAMIIIAHALMMWYTGVTNVMMSQLDFAAGKVTEEALQGVMAAFTDGTKSLILRTLLLLVPAIAITGPFTAGISYVTRNWARDEHSFVWSDFKEAAKQNWKHALIVSTITGFMPLMVYVSFHFYGELSAGTILFAIPQIICVLLAVLWMCSLLFIYPQMVTYELSFKELIFNSMLMTVGRLPMVLGIKLLSLVPAAIAACVALFTPYFYQTVFVVMTYYIFLGFALSRFIGASYSNAVFDKYLNPRIDGAEVGRGLYKEEEDDDNDPYNLERE